MEFRNTDEKQIESKTVKIASNENHLVIIGGAKGVGKTTLAKEYCPRTGFDYRHPGDWFVKYLYEIDPRIIEGLALHDILTGKDEMAVDLHYQTYIKPIGYAPGLQDDSLKLLSAKFETANLFLIELPPEMLLERRIADNAMKKRKLDINIIKEELKRNEESFEHFIDVLSKETLTQAQVLQNIDFEETLKQMLPEAQLQKYLNAENLF